MVNEDDHHQTTENSKSFLTSEGSDNEVVGVGRQRIDSEVIHALDLSILDSILS